jgi:hypothetical protein
MLDLKMEVVFLYETMVCSQNTIRRKNPGDNYLNSHRSENLKSYIEFYPKWEHTGATETKRKFRVPKKLRHNLLIDKCSDDPLKACGCLCGYTNFGKMKNK